uniref:LamG-like jellyroll fold domain-containing protein n=1 Tax=Flavobacterium sp. TaxID=239 RepID=UPI004049879A
MKLKLLITGLFLSVISWAQVPTNGLVKEYDFTYGSGNQYLTSNVQSSLQSGSVDLIKSGSNAAFTDDRNNNINNALQLNGDYLSSGGTEQAFVNAYTISFWIKSTTLDNANSKFIIHQKGSMPIHGFSVELYNGQIQFYNVFGYGNTSITDVNTVYVTSNLNVADGNWHHVVCAVNSTASSTVFSPYVAWTINYYSKLYIDNYLVGNANQTVVPSYTNGQLVREAINRFQPLYIGSC